MKHYLLPNNYNFYKANLHAHSTVSDGALSPSQLKQAYKDQGYSVLAITDHFKLCDHSELNDENFLFLTGCEIAIVQSGDYEFKFKKCCHLNLYSQHPHRDFLFDFTTEYSPESINNIISEANSNGFLVCYNHPSWSMEDYSFFMEYQGLFAMEIYNTLSDVSGIDEHNSHEYDAMLRSGKQLFPIAADDCHGNLPVFHPHCDMFGGYVMIASPDLTYNSIFNALKNGHFYSSTGPEIYELSIEDNLAKIKCSNVTEIKVITGTRKTARIAVSPTSNEIINEAQFPLCKDNKYIRFELTDKSGKKAYTRAYFI